MSFAFPSTPAVDDQYTGPNGVIYTWDGEKWLGNVETIESASGTTPGVVQLAVASEFPSSVDDEAVTPAYLNAAIDGAASEEILGNDGTTVLFRAFAA